MSQQLFAQFELFRRDAVPDDEPGRRAAAYMQYGEFPGAEVLARQVVDRDGIGDSGGCVIDDTLLAVCRADAEDDLAPPLQAVQSRNAGGRRGRRKILGVRDQPAF
jgi:hypothetical protein